MVDHTPPSTRVGSALGRATTATGLLVLSFAGFQLWGTGLSEAKAQEALAGELAATLDPTVANERLPLAWTGEEPGLDLIEPDDAALIGGAPLPAEPGAVETVEPVVLAALEPLEIGQPFATLLIPSIGVDKTVVEGTTREALRTGPGHYPSTARPGQPGNVAIAGHRTTYGAPFHDIDRLVPGDPIVIETASGTFTYRVEGQPAGGQATGGDGEGALVGHQIVSPEDVNVIADKGDDRLTLTACHPRYSASQRIVVTAILEGQAPVVPAEPEVVAATPPPAPIGWQPSGPVDRVGASPPAPASASAIPSPPAGLGGDDDLGWQPANAGATAGWAALTALVVIVAWGFGRLWRRLPAYLMAGPSFSLCLLTCFGHLDRLLPAT